MPDPEPVPSHVAGYTIMGGKALRFGVFGRDYLGHSQEGLRLLKVLREGEGLVVSDEDYAAQKDDAALLTFEAAQAQGEQRVLTHHTVQAAAFGVLVGGSPLQNEVIETTREFDEEQRCAGTLRATTLVQKVQLLKQVADALAALHEAGRQHPYITPWSVVLEGDRPRLVEVGLGFKPDDARFSRDAVPEDVLVFLAPEVVRAIREGTMVQASPAADVYALAATARAFLHNRVPDPAPAGSPDAPRREQALRGAGIDLRAHELYSRELEELLRRALSPDPQRRPGAKELALGLQRLVEEQRLEWQPVPTWPRYAAIGAVAVVVLVGLLLVIRPDPELVKAHRAYADATRLADPAQRKPLLEQALVENALLPEAQRLLALDAWLAWEKAPQQAGKEQLEQVLQGLEAHLITGRTDELSRAARLVVGLLRRWEQAGPAREKGDQLLDGLTGDDELALLAKAVRQMTAAGPAAAKDEELDKWAQAAASAALPAGPLQRAWLLHDEGQYPREEGDPPVGISLQAEWVGQLIGGVALAARRMQDNAQLKLQAARDAAPCFATKAALGLLLSEVASTPEVGTQARALLDEALQTRDFAEARLALGRLMLAEALRKGAGHREAVTALEAAAAGAPETPGADVASRARQIMAEAQLQEAAALAANPEQNEAALKRLDELLQAVEKEPQLYERYLPDLHIARGLVLGRMKQADKAAEDLLWLFKERDVAQGWAELPAIQPPPPTRQEPALAVAPLFEALVARVEALAGTAKKEDLNALERAMAQARAVGSLPGAKNLDQVRLLLAEVQGALAKVRLLPEGRQVDQALADAEAAARAALEQAGATTRWLEALKAKLEIYKAMARRISPGVGIGQSLAPIKKAL